MVKIVKHITIIALIGFGLLTLFLSSSVIFDWFGIREKEGNYVLFIVWANFISSIIYLTSAYGFIKSKKWTSKLLTTSVAILVLAFIGLLIHIYSGGIYEVKTVKAMIFRTSITVLFTFSVFYNKNKTKPMKINALTLSLISVFIAGCSSNEAKVVTETVIEEHHHKDHEAIVLNNGNKWKVEESMLIYIRNMEVAVNDFEGNDYSTLAKTIDKNIRTLTENCTMEGQAHDELHKWLVPFIGLSEEFDVATEKREQEKIYKAFKSAFEEFNTYFE